MNLLERTLTCLTVLTSCFFVPRSSSLGLLFVLRESQFLSLSLQFFAEFDDKFWYLSNGRWKSGRFLLVPKQFSLPAWLSNRRTDLRTRIGSLSKVSMFLRKLCSLATTTSKKVCNWSLWWISCCWLLLFCWNTPRFPLSNPIPRSSFLLRVIFCRTLWFWHNELVFS